MRHAADTANLRADGPCTEPSTDRAGRRQLVLRGAACGLMTLLPLRTDFHAAQGGRHAADAGRLLANGPFRLTRWVHGAQLVLEKNPRYWNAGAIRLQRIEVPYMTTDAQAELNLFLDGRIAMANIAPDSVRQVLLERQRLRRFADGYARKCT